MTKIYDLELTEAAVLEEGGPFTLFGGESLLLPLDVLDDLWSWGFEHFGRSVVQTNDTQNSSQSALGPAKK